MDPEAQAARRSAATVGVITVPIGVALVGAPSQVARALRLGGPSWAWRAIGVADLALVPGLVAGARRERWMITRAGLNLVIAGYSLSVARREGAVGNKAAVVAMVAATIGDSRTIMALRRTRSAT